MDCLPGKPLLIIGCSARAAAQSALRRGRQVLALDLFGDADLARAASAHARIDPGAYPDALPRAAQALPAAPFVVTGGLENHAGIVETLESHRRNEGSDARSLRRVRDPFLLREALLEAGLASPRVLRHPPEPREGWLQKPLNGAGGHGILAAGDRALHDEVKRDHYYQEFVRGTSCAAVYDNREGGALELLGITRQLTGEATLNAPPFGYCGSLGPLDPGEAVVERFRLIGETLVRRFGLRGIFGVDAILHDNEPSTVEVNPRYTASVEVLELSHELGPESSSRRKLGKAILFAHEDLEVRDDWMSESLVSAPPGRSGPWLGVADVPVPGTHVPAGRPIMTCFALGKSIDACRTALLEYAGDIYRRLQ